MDQNDISVLFCSIVSRLHALKDSETDEFRKEDIQACLADFCTLEIVLTTIRDKLRFYSRKDTEIRGAN